MKRALLPLVAGLLLILPEARADVRLNSLFADHMVIQRDKPIRVWGWADPGEEVKVTLGEKSATTKAGADGRWSVELPALDKGENLELTVTAKNPSPPSGSAAASTITLKDVIIGDVWICSGQSNMGFPLSACLNAAEDIKGADFPRIRRFIVGCCPSLYREENAALGSAWARCTPESAPGFSGAAFYFAREVQAKTGVPIGLIVSAVGGTCIEPWMAEADPQRTAREIQAFTTGKQMAELARVEKDLAGLRESLKSGALHDSDGKAAAPPSVSVKALTGWENWIPQMREAIKKGRYVDESGHCLPDPPDLHLVGRDVWTKPPGSGYFPVGAPCWWFQFQPSCLYRGMIHPLTRFPIKGVIWYQGESNGLAGSSVGDYVSKQTALVASWRKAWGQPSDFPFYYVQLPGWKEPGTKANLGPAGGGGWVNVQEAQLKCLNLPNVGMAVAVDIGDSNDIHPKNKYDIGMRLARLALARDYGVKDLEVSGPIYKEMKVEGDKLRLFFDYADSGLMIGVKKGREPVVEDKAGKLKWFAIAGSDRKWVWAEAVVDGKTVLVSSPEVKDPAAVRYAYIQDPAGANLYNREGLPASPFRTDNW